MAAKRVKRHENQGTHRDLHVVVAARAMQIGVWMLDGYHHGPQEQVGGWCRRWLRLWALGVRGASRGANEDGRGAVESILNGQKRSEAGKVGSDTNAMKRIALALALGLPRALCRRGD